MKLLSNAIKKNLMYDKRKPPFQNGKGENRS